MTDRRESANLRVWEFDRYVNGCLKAEGVRISMAKTFEEACLSAVSLASPGSVLVLRPTDETRALATYRELNYAQLCELCARLEAENAALKGATLKATCSHTAALKIVKRDGKDFVCQCGVLIRVHRCKGCGAVGEPGSPAYCSADCLENALNGDAQA